MHFTPSGGGSPPPTRLIPGGNDISTLEEQIAAIANPRVQSNLDAGDAPLALYQYGDNTRAVAWDINKKVERDGKAPILPKISGGLMPIPGTAWRTPNNIPVVVISGKAIKGVAGRVSTEISRDLVAPAALAAIDLGTMPTPDQNIRTQMWYNNMVVNRQAIASGTAVQKDRFKGQPVIIAGAGPSLEKHVGLLETCEFPVLLTNRALKVVNPRGKHFMSIDYLGAEEWFEGVDCSETEAVFDVLSSDTAVKQNWKATRWFRQTYAGDIANAAARDWYPKLPLIDPGHCVAYAAMGLALWWGADPIIFVGQDFSFGPDLKMHAGEGAKSVRLDRAVYRVNDAYGNQTATNDLLISACCHVMGSIVLTSMYGAMWGRPPMFVNCSEQGLLDIPVKIPLDEALDRCRKDIESMRAKPVALPHELRNPRKRIDTNAKKQWLKRRLDRKPSWYSTQYAGPENPERLSGVDDVVKIKDPWGRDVLVPISERAEAEKQFEEAKKVIEASDDGNN